MTARAHVLILVLTIGTVVLIVQLLRRRQLRSKYALLWLTIAVLLLPLAALPGLLEVVADWFGVQYAPAAFLFLAAGFLFFVVLQFSWELSRVDRRMRTLAEDVALLRTALEDAEQGRPPPS